MDAKYSFTEEVCTLSFDVWDIDETDELVIEAFNDGTPVMISASSGQCVAQFGSDTFMPDGSSCEVQVSGDVSHKITVSISSCVTDIRIKMYDQGTSNNGGGSYTTVFKEGCTDDLDDGTLEGGPFEFCVSNGEADNIPTGSIALSGNSGANSTWVVTDDQGNILGLPPMPSDVDFDVAGQGTCFVWHLSFEEGLTGLQIGQNVSNFQGCYSLSNSISVFRNESGAICNVTCPETCSTPYLALLDGSDNGMADINNASLTVGNAILTVHRSFNGTAVVDENKINASQTSGDVGLRLDVAHAIGSANNMEAVFSFSEAVCGLHFEVWDINQTDEIVIRPSIMECQ